MYNIGVDFGSTYSAVSVYRDATQTVEAKALTEGGAAVIPSVLSVKRGGTVSIGQNAKSVPKAMGAQSFRAFKMLIAEDNEELLKSRGFTQEYTPCKVTELFLGKMLEMVMKCDGERNVDNLVVGVPEVWFSKLNTVDGCARLRDICQSLPFMAKKENVQIVSEPAAATAYFAHNYHKLNNSLFKGKLLLVDYGGGTLDITLTDVEPRKGAGKSDEMEIRVIFRTGAGESEGTDQIGKAGIAYMEQLAAHAIRTALPEERVAYDSEFSKAVDELENNLKYNQEEIEAVFSQYGTDHTKLTNERMSKGDFDDFYFCNITYKFHEIPVTYAMMAKVYDSVIRKVFDEKLDEVIAFMESKGYPYMDRYKEDFKIMLVGGFGNYYLVQKQMEEKFKFTHSDRRDKGMIKGREECERAISFGTALLSAGVVKIRNTAPFSIGVDVRDFYGNPSITFGLRYGEDIVFDKEYLQRDQNGNPIMIFSTSGSLETFIINQTMENDVALRIPTKPEYRKKLAAAVQSPNSPVVVGFSLDKSSVLSLHIHYYDIINDVIDPAKHTIELSSFNNLFDRVRCERVGKKK